MNKLIILGLVMVGLNCLVQAKMITVTVKEGKASLFHDHPEDFKVDDGITVRELAMQVHGFSKYNVPKDLRLENHLMIKYNMDKTLEESGIKDGSTVILKYWGKGDDLKANAMRLLGSGIQGQ